MNQKNPQKNKKSLNNQKEDSSTSNQKKITYRKSKVPKHEETSSGSDEEIINEKKHKLLTMDMFLNEYMVNIITKTSDYTFICKYCARNDGSEGEENEENGIEMFGENLFNHLKTKRHHNNTPDDELDELEELLKKIDEFRSSKGQGKKKKVLQNPDEKSFLEFIALTVSLRLSYSQISKLGSFLKDFAQSGRLNFFKNHFFDEEVISKVVKDCFRPVLVNKIYDDISKTPFSLSLDTSTVCTESICALRVRYLKEKIDNQKKVPVKYIENKLLGIKTMGESSDSQALLAIVEGKVLKNDDISQNFVGITHDNASCFTGSNTGLIVLLRDKLKKEFYDLPDPCHGLNLALQHALETLPDQVMDFVNDIHTYFSYPQRKVKFKNLQQENNQQGKLLLKYGHTRWLSLAQCLQRLIDLWGPLINYMNQSPPNKQKQKEANKIKSFKSSLENESFYLKILFLEHVIKKISNVNQQLQSQTLDISKLKIRFKTCFNSILEIVCVPEKFETPFLELITKDWEDTEVQKEYFMKGKDFIQLISELINPKFSKLFMESQQIQENFIQIFQDFIAILLNLFTQYFNFADEVIEAADFLELDSSYHILKSKISKFNSIFKLFSEEELKQSFDELLVLRDEGTNKYRDNTSKSSLSLWNNINETQAFPLLVKIANLALTLPTSSSDVEQIFSIMKLFKSDQRNSLAEASLEGLLLVHQEFKNNGKIEITNDLVELYKLVKKEINQRKEKKRKNEQISPEDIQPNQEILLSEENQNSNENVFGAHALKKQKSQVKDNENICLEK